MRGRWMRVRRRGRRGLPINTPVTLCGYNPRARRISRRTRLAKAKHAKKDKTGAAAVEGEAGEGAESGVSSPKLLRRVKKAAKRVSEAAARLDEATGELERALARVSA